MVFGSNQFCFAKFDHGNDQTNRFCDGKGQPDTRSAQKTGKHPANRNDDDELTQERDHERMASLTKRLKYA